MALFTIIACEYFNYNETGIRYIIIPLCACTISLAAVWLIFANSKDVFVISGDFVPNRVIPLIYFPSLVGIITSLIVSKLAKAS